MNNPTYFEVPADVNLRKAEVPNADWATGMNSGASNAPGIGINYADPPTPVAGTHEQFTLRDQDGAARTPQNSALISNRGHVSSARYPSSGGLPGNPKNPISGGTNGALGNGEPVRKGNMTLSALTGWTAV